jgi:hypothetical protein
MTTTENPAPNGLLSNEMLYFGHYFRISIGYIILRNFDEGKINELRNE